jgi:hypothetical protein
LVFRVANECFDADMKFHCVMLSWMLHLVKKRLRISVWMRVSSSTAAPE